MPLRAAAMYEHAHSEHRSGPSTHPSDRYMFAHQ